METVLSFFGIKADISTIFNIVVASLTVLIIVNTFSVAKNFFLTRLSFINKKLFRKAAYRRRKEIVLNAIDKEELMLLKIGIVGRMILFSIILFFCFSTLCTVYLEVTIDLASGSLYSADSVDLLYSVYFILVATVFAGIQIMYLTDIYARARKRAQIRQGFNK